MKTIMIDSRSVPALGMGTWYLGEGNAQQNETQLKTLRFGLDHGLKVIDTAEMYGNGASETLVGKVIKPYKRDSIYLISKFYPTHARAKQLEKALKNSLQRLQTDYLDLYLYHWRGSTPLVETLAELQKLQQAGLIKHYGVSNFDVADLKETATVPGGEAIIANEVLYNLATRGIEYDLIPYDNANHLVTIGYSPYGSGAGNKIALNQALKDLAATKHISGHQLLLAWALRQPNLISIPKSSSIDHMKENIAAADITFTKDELAVIDTDYPKPTHKIALGML